MTATTSSMCATATSWIEWQVFTTKAYTAWPQPTPHGRLSQRNVPPGVHLGRRVSYRNELLQFITSIVVRPRYTTALDAIVIALNRTDCNSDTRMPTATVRSRRIATAWYIACFLFQTGDLLFNSSGPETGEEQSTLSDTHLSRCCKLLLDTPSSVNVPALFTLSRSRWSRSSEVNSLLHEQLEQQHWLIRLKAESCSNTLKEVNHLKTPLGSTFIHHLGVHHRAPCYGCHSASHSQSHCKLRDVAAARARHTLAIRRRGGQR